MLEIRNLVVDVEDKRILNGLISAVPDGEVAAQKLISISLEGSGG
jgi:Fe-S cluster assembly ATPase SufC